MANSSVTARSVGAVLHRKLGSGQVKIQGAKMKTGLVRVWLPDTPGTVYTTMDQVTTALDYAGFSFRPPEGRTVLVYDPELHEGAQ